MKAMSLGSPLSPAKAKLAMGLRRKVLAAKGRDGPRVGTLGSARPRRPRVQETRRTHTPRSRL